jgi:hypothetical protein
MTCWDQQLLAGEPADAGIAKCSSLLPQTSRILPCVAMGSMPEGTLCVYCGVHEAGYIIDGCCGPIIDVSSPSKPGWTRLANGNKAGGEDNRRRRWMCRGCGGKPRNRYTCAQCHRWFCPQCVEAGAHECLKERAHQPRWDEPQGRIWPCSRTGTLEERIHRFQQELDRYHEGRKRSEQQQQQQVRSLYCNKCYYAPWAKQWIARSRQNGITVWGRKRSEQQQRPACDHQR